MGQVNLVAIPTANYATFDDFHLGRLSQEVVGRLLRFCNTNYLQDFYHGSCGFGCYHNFDSSIRLNLLGLTLKLWFRLQFQLDSLYSWCILLPSSLLELEITQRQALVML